MIEEKYPSLDVSDVMVIEPYRPFSQPFVAFGMIGGGVIITVLGLVLFFVRRKKSYEKWDDGLYWLGVWNEQAVE